MLVVLNPAPANKDIIDILEYVDIIIPNKNELKTITGEDDIDTASRLLLSYGTKCVITTLGDKGYYYVDSENKHYGKCLRVEVVDTTGAGDTFCGALVAKLSKEASMNEAVQFASTAASLAVTKKAVKKEFQQ